MVRENSDIYVDSFYLRENVGTKNDERGKVQRFPFLF